MRVNLRTCGENSVGLVGRNPTPPSLRRGRLTDFARRIARAPAKA
jgi:hypothetical protein